VRVRRSYSDTHPSHVATASGFVTANEEVRNLEISREYICIEGGGIRGTTDKFNDPYESHR
jgi:hypothetical protein